MNVIFIILLCFAFVFLIVFLFKSWLTTSDIVKAFKSCNVIVFGKKGTGKDLIFQKVINKRKKENYYSNVNYSHKFNYCSPSVLELDNNTYSNFISGEINTEIKKDSFEDADFYFSDCGIILPSQYDSTLYKKYPSFPITYALSRHLYSNNIHCNTQNLGRIWKALREQADFYVRTLKTISLPFILCTKVITYDNYESANACLSPMPSSFLNSDMKARREEFIASHGSICSGWVIQLKKNVKYDPREYHKILFGYPFTLKQKKIYNPFKFIYNKFRAFIHFVAHKFRRKNKNEKKN